MTNKEGKNKYSDVMPYLSRLCNYAPFLTCYYTKKIIYSFGKIFNKQKYSKKLTELIELKNFIIYRSDLFFARKPLKYKKSYSQFGEDLMINALFDFLFYKDTTEMRYVDIGANYPIFDNNTYNLYLKHGKGVLVEPNPFFTNLYKKYRPKDTVINAGIRFNTDEKFANYYDFGEKAHGLNTFSEERKNRVIQKFPLIKTHTIPLVDINEVFKKLDYIDFVSIDVEGLELEILKTINFDNTELRPKIFCLEANKIDIECGKKTELTDFMQSKGYVLVGDNFINTFYADISQLKANPSVDIYCNGKKIQV